MIDSLAKNFKAFKRIAWSKTLPPFVYRMDDRAPAFVRGHGLQPKGMRTDGNPGQFGPVNANVSVMEHVRKTFDAGGSCNSVDPWISFFAWHALQPVTADVMAFMHGYLAGYVYMMDTSAALAGGCNLHYAKAEFDIAKRTDGAQYRGQKEWSCRGVAPANSIKFVLGMPVLLAAMVGNSAPDPMTLPWVGLGRA